MRAKKIDQNQPDIVKQLRALHVSVQILSMVGNGCLDTLLGFRGKNFLVEIKNDSMPKSKRTLTQKQEKFMAEWRGQAAVCKTLEEILFVIGYTVFPDGGPRMVDTVGVDNSEPNYK